MLKLSEMRVQLDAFSLRADWALGEAAITAVIGPSGGGKSTLLSAIAGFVPVEAGDVLWGETAMTALPPAKRPISMVFQDNNLFPHLSAAQNVGLGLRPALRLTSDEQDRVQQALRDVGLGDMAQRMPGALSGGQQSRVALARVLVSQRALVLMDEPFSALGPGLRYEMLDMARDVLAQGNRQLLMVTHDPQDAKRIADQVCFVDQGRAEAPVAVTPFFAQPSAQLEAYLGAQ